MCCLTAFSSKQHAHCTSCCLCNIMLLYVVVLKHMPAQLRQAYANTARQTHSYTARQVYSNQTRRACVDKTSTSKTLQALCREDSGKSTEQHSWGCPKCRTTYLPAEVPTEYRCFCGKQRNPPLDPWLAPHTCGDICGRQLPSGCGHSCVLLCHPGPCPPCPRQV